LQLVSDDRARQLPRQAVVVVADRGDDYEVRVTSATSEARRRFDDPNRECERRVRFAAVFAITTLMPPELADSEVAEPPAPPPPRAPAQKRPLPTIAPPAARHVRLELTGFAELSAALPGDARVLGFGGELRGAIGGSGIRATLAVGYVPETELTLGEFTGRIERLIGSAGIRVPVVAGPLPVFADAGVEGALERIRGTSPYRPAAATALQLGVRAALVVALTRETQLTPLLSLFATWVPAPRAIEKSPNGTIGNTPALWLGAGAGVALDL
jgi:hypothetical protein